MGATTHTDAGAAAFAVTLHDPMRDTDADVAERVEFSNEFTEEVLPGETPTPVDRAIAALRASPERLKRWSFRARDASGRLAALASTGYDPEHDDNPDVFFINITVRAEYRRQGLGHRLLVSLVELAEAEGRKRLVGHTQDRVAGAIPFAEATGAGLKSRAHMNHLPTADVDRAHLERWAHEGPSRAPGYELIAWDGPVPDEYMDKYLELVLVMNDAPRDDLEINDFTITAQEVREAEERMAATATEAWTIVARRVEDDAWAGFHDMSWSPADPTNMYVGSTGVRPEHRGHALGKWLKATMQLRVLDERPEVVDVRTGNADSNDAMLGINKEMGYKPLIAQSTWEITTEAARAFVDSHGV